jgi:hypothetical protein
METMPQGNTNEFVILQEALPETHDELLAHLERLQTLARTHAADDQMVFQPIQDRMNEAEEKLKMLAEEPAEMA